MSITLILPWWPWWPRWQSSSCAQGTPACGPPRAGTEAAVRQLAPRLAPSQAQLLAPAIDTGQDVVIGYLAASGSRTQRQIGDLILVGGAIHAWCELRQDERVFSVSRIESVRPALATAPAGLRQ